MLEGYGEKRDLRVRGLGDFLRFATGDSGDESM